MYILRLFLVTLLALYLPGCTLLNEDEPRGVFLEVNGTEFNPEEEVELTLVNYTPLTFITHPTLCDAVLEVRTDDGWERTPEEYERVCTRVGTEVKSGGLVRAVRTVHSTAGPGVYRYILSITPERGGDGNQGHLTIATEPIGLLGQP